MAHADRLSTPSLEQFVRGVQAATRKVWSANAHFRAAYDLGVMYFPAPPKRGANARAKKAVQSELRKASAAFDILDRTFGQMWFCLEAMGAEDGPPVGDPPKDEILKLWTFADTVRTELGDSTDILCRVIEELRNWRNKVAAATERRASIPLATTLEVLGPCHKHACKCFAAVRAAQMSLDQVKDEGRASVERLFGDLSAAERYVETHFGRKKHPPRDG